jgi:hypothetical protein
LFLFHFYPQVPFLHFWPFPSGLEQGKAPIKCIMQYRPLLYWIMELVGWLSWCERQDRVRSMAKK